MKYHFSKTIIKVVKQLLVIALICCLHNGQAQDQRAAISLKTWEEDGHKYIKAQLNEVASDSLGQAIPDVDVNFYVQRTFSLLPIGGRFNTTDEQGEVTAEFPADLPGDTLGNVTIFVKLIDADDFADTAVSQTLPWGVPTVIDHSENKRTLWAASANAPITLLIVVNALILVVWGIMAYVVFRLYAVTKM